MNTNSKSRYSYLLLWFAANLLLLLWFDILWCGMTSFRPFRAYMSLYVFLPAAAGLFTIPAILCRKTWIQASVSSLLGIFLVCNLMYCRTYFVQIPLQSYSLASNLSNFTGSVIASVRPADVVFLLILAAAIIGSRFCSRRQLQLKVKYSCFAALLILCSLSYATIAGRGGFTKRLDTMARSVNDTQTATAVYTPFIPLLHEAISISAPLTAEQTADAEQWFAEHRQLIARNDQDLLPPPISPNKLIVIMLESLESWPLGTEINGQPITPFLNSLVADSTVYFNPNVRTQTRDGRSIDAQLLYLAGQYPLAKGVYSVKCVSNPYNTIATEMKSKGAKTFLFSSDMPSTWNAAGIDRAFGIDTLLTCDRLGIGTPTPSTMPFDADMYDAAAAYMKASPDWQPGSPAFGLMVTLTSHTPFSYVPADFQFNTSGLPETLGRYITSVAYADMALGKFIENRRNDPAFNETVIAITGDHEGLATLRADFVKNHAFVDSLQHTPLIILNSPFTGRDSTEIDQVDVYPALLDAMGLYGSAKWKGMGISPFHHVDLPEEHRRSAPYIGDLILRFPNLIK